MGSRNEEIEEFPLNLERIFNSPKYTDFTIKTSDQDFQVHKLVLYAQSEYFSRMLSSNWKETENNEIELKEDDPRAIEAMIRYLYGFRDELKGGRDISSMLLIAMVYGVAEKYEVFDLKQRAKTKFQETVRTCWDQDDFPSVIDEVYTKSPSRNRDLRDPLVRTAQENITALMVKKEFRDVLKEYIGFTTDVLQALVERGIDPPGLRIVNCFKCNATYSSSADYGNRFYCMCCGKAQFRTAE